MKLCIIGTGYVGLVTGSCFADMGNDVICVDKDKKKIEALKKGEVGIYEPGLSDMVSRNFSHGRLVFTTDLEKGIKNSLICFICVGTPENEDGSADLKHVLDVAKGIGKVMDGYKIIVDKSTVPVGTANLVAKAIKKETNHEFDVVSNPEFLKEGAAVDDFMKPERVIIGTDDVRVAEIMKELYAPFTRTGKPTFVMDVKSAELTKYASNAFLATKISFMNEIANLCDNIGANVEQVRRGMGSDSRIGSKFLFPGIGFGGSCFPKDLAAIIKTGNDIGITLKVAKSVMEVNYAQREVFVKKITSHFGGGVKDLTIAIWGLSFKPQTDDIREAPSLTVAEMLLEGGAKLKVFDPAAMDSFKSQFGERVFYAEDAYDSIKGADALVIITEWNEFRNPDFPRIKQLMKNPVIFDGRNQYNREEIERMGFVYYCIGRPGGEGGER